MRDKKITLYLVYLFITLLVLFTFGCSQNSDPNQNSNEQEEKKERTTSTDAFIYDNILIKDNELLLEINFHINEDKLDKTDELVSYGAIVTYKNIVDIKDLSLDNTNNDLYFISLEIDSTDNEMKFNFNTDLEDNYEHDISVRLYYTYTDDMIEYHKLSNEYITKNIYDIAVNSTSQYAKTIVKAVDNKGKIVITEINIILDTKNYTVTLKNEEDKSSYTVSMEDPDYNYIHVICTLKENVILDDDFVFICNDVEIDKDDITITDNTISYSIDDPNWTKIY